MYHCNLKVFTVGLTPDTLEILKNVRPLEKFMHTFYDAAGGIPDLSNEHDAVLIADDKSGITPREMRAAAGERNMCILCTQAPEKFSAETLALLNDIWTDVSSPEMLRFRFGLLQNHIKAKKDLWMTKTLLDDTIEALPDMIWYKNIDGIHMKVNNTFCDVVQKPKSDVEGFDHCHIWNVSRELFDKGTFSCQKSDNETIGTKRPTISEEKVMMDQSLHTLKTYKAPILSEYGDSVLGTVGIARDVTVEYAYRDQILEMAHTDYLTGFANRRYMYEYVNARRGNKKLTVLFCDIDKFKKINDQFGHLIGDAALIAVSRAMKEIFGDAFLVRPGGDEFFAIFTKGQDTSALPEQVAELNERLKSTAINGVNLTVSAGAASTDSPHVSLDELINRSDIALYKAKQQGNGLFCAG